MWRPFFWQALCALWRQLAPWLLLIGSIGLIGLGAWWSLS